MLADQVLFWTVAPILVLASSTLLFARKAVHVAAALIVVMVGLAVLFVNREAPFLGVVQIVVYTGAIMMLFLFVLMLVGVDRKESLAETIRGQRWIALAGALGLAALVSVAGFKTGYYRGSLKASNSLGNPNVVGNELFGDWMLAMELVGFVLVAAAIGALVLTHVPRLGEKSTQAERSDQRIRQRLNPVNKPMPGVYARRNALDVAALGPDGKPVKDSASRVLEAREQIQSDAAYRAPSRRKGKAK